MNPSPHQELPEGEYFLSQSPTFVGAATVDHPLHPWKTDDKDADAIHSESPPPLLSVPVLSLTTTTSTPSLPQLVNQLSTAVHTRLQQGILPGSAQDPILQVLEHTGTTHLLQLLQPHAHFDPTRPYTRNLIHTDHSSYTLLLLCWNPGQSSPIHNHPCDACWMKVLQGAVQELSLIHI